MDVDLAAAEEGSEIPKRHRVAREPGNRDVLPYKRAKTQEIDDKSKNNYLNSTGPALTTHSSTSWATDSDGNSAEDIIAHAEAARLSGLPPYEMSADERRYYPEYQDYSVDYVKIRNMIVFLWRLDRTSFLGWTQVLKNVVVRSIHHCSSIFPVIENLNVKERQNNP
jgi:hypothetical protein